MAYNDRRFFTGVNVDFNTDITEDVPIFAVNQQIQIHDIAITVTSTQTGTTAVTFEVADDDTGLDARTLGTVNVPANSLGICTHLYFSPPKVLIPGEFVTWDSVKSGTAPTGILQIEYSLLDEAASDNPDFVATT